MITPTREIAEAECTDCSGNNPCAECAEEDIVRSEVEYALQANIVEETGTVSDIMVNEETGENMELSRNIDPIRNVGRLTILKPEPLSTNQRSTTTTDPQPVPAIENYGSVLKEKAEEEPKKLWLWVAIGAGVIILIAIIAAILKKKK